MLLVTGASAAPGPGGSAAPGLVHTPGDVVRAAECEHALLRRVDELLGRAPRRERTADVMDARIAALGEAHRRRTLDLLRDRHGAGPTGVVEVASPGTGPAGMPVDELVAAHARTLGALEQGAAVVAGGWFFDGRVAVRADFLARAGEPGAGVPAPYAVWEATFARRAGARALLRVGAAAVQLAAAGVDPTGQGHLLLGTRPDRSPEARLSHHELGEVLPVFRARRDRMLEVVAAHLADDGPADWDDPRFTACGRLGTCPDCAAAAEERRDVLLVGGVYERQRASLAAAGVTTIDALAAAEEPPPGLAAGTFSRLRDQAALQLGTAPGDGRVRYEVAGPDGPEPAELRWSMPDPTAVDRLPLPSPGDVFFDFEGDPWWTDADGAGPASGGGLDYLFGWVTRPGVDGGADGGADDVTPPFHGLWADTPAQERDALVAFVDWLTERRRRWPDLHVYHYADYERAHLVSIAARHGTYEDEVDDLVRDGVLVDLWGVVRPSLRISYRSRSIKRLEPLYMAAEPDREGVTDGAASIVEYAEYTALRAAGDDAAADERQAQILDYNRYDCVSTLRLLDWLRAARAQVNGARAAAPGMAPAEPAVPLAQVEEPAEPARRRPTLEAQLRAEAEVARDHREHGRAGDDVRALALLGAAVGYHRREARPVRHEHVARLELPPEEWPWRRSSMVVTGAAVRRGWGDEPGRPAPVRLLELVGRFVEGSELVPGAPVWLFYDDPVPPGVAPPGGRSVRGAHARASVVAVEPVLPGVDAGADDGGRDATRRGSEAQRLVVREEAPGGATPSDALPMGVAVDATVPTGPQEQAVEDAAAEALAAWRAGGALPAGPATDLLARRTPRLTGGGTLPELAPGAGSGEPEAAGAVLAAVTRLDRSYLAVQSPPGTGGASLAVHVVARLVAAGWRVGVVAPSRAAVESLVAAARRAGVPADRLVGGTAEDFSRGRGPAGGLDLLVIDDAGRFALAETIAVARAASRLLLVGDPRRLGPASRGSHPEPAVAGSALGWLTGGRGVLPERYGYVLAASRRMHPALCDAVSRLAYDGRLHAHPRAADRRLEGVAPGVRQVLVDPDVTGSGGSSVAEAAEVVRQAQAVLGRSWHDGDAPARPLVPGDVLVVTPYDAQVRVVRAALDAAGLPDVPVGTVDRVQERQAVVVVLTLAASSPDRVPRGRRFLLSRDRLGAALSRGQWCAVVVRSTRLADYLPHSVRGLEQLGAFLRLGDAGR